MILFTYVRRDWNFQMRSVNYVNMALKLSNCQLIVGRLIKKNLTWWIKHEILNIKHSNIICDCLHFVQEPITRVSFCSFPAFTHFRLRAAARLLWEDWAAVNINSKYVNNVSNNIVFSHLTDIF